MKRKIVKIDEEKCDGCGLCVSACAEGAIELVDGKAKLVSDIYCDGLGACLGECPRDAITIEERDADEFDEKAVEERLKQTRPEKEDHRYQKPGGCPGMKAFEFKNDAGEEDEVNTSATPSALTQWPIQLQLVPVNAPYWQNADVLIAADCTAFSLGGFHGELLRGKKLIIACPKLDDTSSYVEKLAAIFTENEIKSITVAHMEVPCCTGLINIARQALENSGKPIPFSTVKVSVKGEKE